MPAEVALGGDEATFVLDRDLRLREAVVRDVAVHLPVRSWVDLVDERERPVAYAALARALATRAAVTTPLRFALLWPGRRRLCVFLRTPGAQHGGYVVHVRAMEPDAPPDDGPAGPGRPRSA